MSPAYCLHQQAKCVSRNYESMALDSDQNHVHTNLKMTDATRTARLPNPNWRPSAAAAHGVVAAMQTLTRTARPAVVRGRTPRNTASMAVTQELPVVGRAGTKERVRMGDATFGGGEAR